MAVTFTIEYADTVVKEDIPKLTASVRSRTRKAIESKLTVSPEVYGKPLRRSLKGYKKLRVGEYRVVFRIENTTIKVFVIQHRSVVYNTAEKRL